MKLQVALDTVDTIQALEIVSKIHDVADIIEIGTPMILSEGMLPVKMIKAAYPQLVVLADTKIVDAGELEADEAFKAGADIVTVLALAWDVTLQAVVRAARKHGKQVMADLTCVEDPARRAARLDELDIDYICVHTGVDEQKSGKTPLDDLERVLQVLHHSKATVAGGISLGSMAAVKAVGPEIVVVGGAVSRAPDMRQAVLALKSAMQQA
ncbi:MAG TPA: orotidine 5'-phosphate decarboxylase [Anaerolineaceae bacterium]|nr:orotidine 5'-phosphate decarboxylase [Anaerolineaceae bacterium]HQN05699.1 orotidine 5'-phosphate decarboxylase [Anaerolineaceae bacterium]HQP09526.1 orotidine 5'-phosphate decarboxylase [Anaerolineaceae bacterium]